MSKNNKYGKFEDEKDANELKDIKKGGKDIKSDRTERKSIKN